MSSRGNRGPGNTGSNGNAGPVNAAGAAYDPAAETYKKQVLFELTMATSNDSRTIWQSGNLKDLTVRLSDNLDSLTVHFLSESINTSNIHSKSCQNPWLHIEKHDTLQVETAPVRPHKSLPNKSLSYLEQCSDVWAFSRLESTFLWNSQF